MHRLCCASVFAQAVPSKKENQASCSICVAYPFGLLLLDTGLDAPQLVSAYQPSNLLVVGLKGHLQISRQ